MQSRPVRLAAAAGVCAIVFGLAACSDEPDPEEASEEVTGSESTPAEGTEAGPELPITSGLVNLGTGGCLRAFPDTPPPHTYDQDCADSAQPAAIQTFTISTAEDGTVQIRHVDPENEDSDTNGCLEWDHRGALNFESECSTDFGWNLTYLESDEGEGIDYWRFQANDDQDMCLTVGGPSPDSDDLQPGLDACDDGDENQRWGTESAR